MMDGGGWDRMKMAMACKVLDGVLWVLTRRMFRRKK